MHFALLRMLAPPLLDVEKLTFGATDLPAVVINKQLFPKKYSASVNNISLLDIYAYCFDFCCSIANSWVDSCV